MQKSQWKIDFLPIFYPIFQDLCHFIHLWNIPKIFGVAWGGGTFAGLGGVLSSLGDRGGVGGLYKSLISYSLVAPEQKYNDILFVLL